MVEELNPETTHPAGPCHPGGVRWMGPKSPKVPSIIVTWSWAGQGQGCAVSSTAGLGVCVASPVTQGPAPGLELCCGRLDSLSNFIFELVLCKCGLMAQQSPGVSREDMQKKVKNLYFSIFSGTFFLPFFFFFIRGLVLSAALMEPPPK